MQIKSTNWVILSTNGDGRSRRRSPQGDEPADPPQSEAKRKPERQQTTRMLPRAIHPYTTKKPPPCDPVGDHTMKNTPPSRGLREQGFTGAEPPTPHE